MAGNRIGYSHNRGINNTKLSHEMNDINSSKLQTTTGTPIVAIPCWQLFFDVELKKYPKRSLVSTIDLVRMSAKAKKTAQYKVKEQLEVFLNDCFEKGISKQRTSEIFLSKRERHCCPKYQDAYISHLVT